MAPALGYVSTNRTLHGARRVRPVSFADALFAGLAPDGGLFMPDRIPRLNTATIAAMRGRPYRDIAFAVLEPFLGRDLGTRNLTRMCTCAYDFPVPIERMDDATWLVRLDRGPTASFKDFAARFMACCMAALKPPRRRITILVATSGDTGSAVGEAFRGIEGFSVHILYPRTEVSPVQKWQLDGIGLNVHAVSLDGTFDDCQRLIKQAFLDPDLHALSLTSANSINIGRILPQVVYHFHAHAHVAATAGSPLVFAVPSGNFGNSFGAELAARMGLPVRRLVVAVNANAAFPRFLDSGVFRALPSSIACMSNAMNVGNPSNLARYFDLYGGTVDKDGVVHRKPDIVAMRRRLFSVSISDKATIAAMRRAYRVFGTVLEPHGAVGFAALERYRAHQGVQPAVCFETAHPAKFPGIVRDVLGVKTVAPEALRAAASRPRSCVRLDNSYASLKHYLQDHELD